MHSGSNWVVLHRSFSEYVERSPDNVARFLQVSTLVVDAESVPKDGGERHCSQRLSAVVCSALADCGQRSTFQPWYCIPESKWWHIKTSAIFRIMHWKHESDTVCPLVPNLGLLWDFLYPRWKLLPDSDMPSASSRFPYPPGELTAILLKWFIILLFLLGLIMFIRSIDDGNLRTHRITCGTFSGPRQDQPILMSFEMPPTPW